MACSRTPAVGAEPRRHDAGAGGDEQREADAADAAEQPDPAGERPRARVVAGAERGADQGLRGDGEGVEHQRGEEPELQGDLVGADGGGAEAGGDGGRGQEAGLERQPTDQQVPAEHQLLADHAGPGSQRHPLGDQGGGEEHPAERLRDDVGHRRADQTQPAGVDQQRAEQRGEQVGAEHEEQGAAGVLHAAQPAVAGGGEQQAGSAEGRDPQPLRGGVGDLATTTGEGTGERAAAELHADRDQQTDTERQPGRLDAFGDGGGPVTRAEAAGRAPGGAVGDHGADPGGERHDRAADGERGERHPAEVTDHGRVDQHVERFGGEHHEGRQGERGDPARRGGSVGGWRRWFIAADPGTAAVRSTRPPVTYGPTSPPARRTSPRIAALMRQCRRHPGLRRSLPCPRLPRGGTTTAIGLMTVSDNYPPYGGPQPDPNVTPWSGPPAPQQGGYPPYGQPPRPRRTTAHHPAAGTSRTRA